MLATESYIDAEKFNETVANNVRFFREEGGFSQDDLAGLSGLSKKTVWKIENRQFKGCVDEYYISALAKALRIEVDAITETNEKVISLIDFLNVAAYKVPGSDEAIAAADEMIEKTANRGPRERALAYMFRGLIHYYAGEYGCASEKYENAREVALRSGDEELLQRVRRNLASSLMMIGMYGRSEELIRMVLESSKNQNKRPYDLFKLGTLLYSKGEFDRSEFYFDEALKFAKPDSDVAGWCKQGLSSIYRRSQKFSKAIETCHEALEIATNCNDHMTVIYSYKTIGDIYRDTDNPDSASMYAQGIEIAKKIGRKYEELLLQYEVAVIEDKYQEARSIAEELTTVEATPNELSYIFITTAEWAYKLGYSENVRFFYRLATEALQKK